MMTHRIGLDQRLNLHSTHNAARTLRRALPVFSIAGAALLGALSACSDSDDEGTTSLDLDGGSQESSTTSSAFQACVDDLVECKTKEMDTAEKMEAASCKSTQFIPIPLTDGTEYGPMTVKGGPYGAKIDWNEGAGTDYVNPVNDSEDFCLPMGIDTFMEPAETTDDLKNTRDLDYSLYTVFRPACMKEGETYPVITWANGTCGLTHGYAILLGQVASYGYVVVASNSTWTNSPPTDSVQARAIDYAEYLNDDSDSVLFGKLDLDNIGAMGHSQGAIATTNVDGDDRVDAVIFWNAGTSNEKPFLNVSGDRDVGGIMKDSVVTNTENASQPGAWVWYHQILETGGNATGHLVLMEQPDRVWEMTVAWWDWQLKGDEEAKKMFVGEDCGLCNRDDEFEYGTNDLVE